MVQTALPVDRYVDEIVDHVRRERFAVVVAPPGSGKTTRIPPALTAIGRTMLLQPRRVAARALTRRIAFERGWTIGEEIGWQIRFERRFSERTRLLVATEGILTARLQSDPLLSEFEVVVLDEFHERSIHADLALALVREAAHSRDDLRVVVMSATMDAESVAAYLSRQTAVGSRQSARIFDIEAKRFPIDVRYRPGATVAQAARDALATAKGDLLCFLPGVREIERARGELAGCGALVLPLHGTLDVDEQERAIRPAATQKIILATNVAETSLTVEGVTDVIDSGVHKILRFDSETAVDHLVTERISRDSADQRAGRAGRTAPGRATRLWDERDILRPHREPEVRRIDLSAAALDIIAWGGDPQTFPWFERPPQERLDAAMELLEALGAITSEQRRTSEQRGASSEQGKAADRGPQTADRGGEKESRASRRPVPPLPPGEGGATPLGKTETLAQNGGTPGEGRAARPKLTSLGDQIRRFPLHPRLARLILEADGAPLAIRIAVALSEGVRLTRSETTASDAFAIADAAPHPVVDEIARIAKNVLPSAVRGPRSLVPEETILRAILAAYPDRVAQRREPKSDRLLLASGTGAVLARESGVREGEFLVALDVAGGGAEALVRMASRIEREWLEPTRREKVHRIVDGRVRAVERLWYGAILLHEQSVAADRDEARALLAREMRSQIDPQLQRRVALAGIDVDWDSLLEQAAAAHRRANDPDLVSFLPYDQRRKLDSLAPASIPLPSGRSARLEYRDDGSLFAAVKLQELFGLGETPRVGPQKTPVTFELLAPNGRPVQVTRDLRSFWNGTYAEVRKELRARYPKHPWPEDPWTATPTHRTKRR